MTRLRLTGTSFGNIWNHICLNFSALLQLVALQFIQLRILLRYFWISFVSTSRRRLQLHISISKFPNCSVFSWMPCLAMLESAKLANLMRLHFWRTWKHRLWICSACMCSSRDLHFYTFYCWAKSANKWQLGFVKIFSNKSSSRTCRSSMQIAPVN